MKIVAVIVFLLIGFVTNWGDAFFWFFGYCFAFAMVGWMKYRGEL